MRLSDVLAYLLDLLKREHMACLLQQDVLVVSTATVHGRYAARALAYSVAAEDPATATAILNRVGREG